MQVRGEEVPDDWDERWKRFHVPVLVGGRLYVRPPWEQPAVRPGVTEIVIDPGQAFGTGSHPTTRLCLELLLELEPRGLVRRPRLRLGRAGDRGGEARLRAGRRVRLRRAAVEATRANARDNAVALDRVERWDLRARRAAAPRARSRRT